MVFVASKRRNESGPRRTVHVPKLIVINTIKIMRVLLMTSACNVVAVATKRTSVNNTQGAFEEREKIVHTRHLTKRIGAGVDDFGSLCQCRFGLSLSSRGLAFNTYTVLHTQTTLDWTISDPFASVQLIYPVVEVWRINLKTCKYKTT